MRTRAITRLRSISPLVWLLMATLALLLPFLNKAFHIDDTLFLRSAEQIQKHPLDFYGFNINWFETSKPMVEAFWNPPLLCYALAIAAKLTGWHEFGLHAVLLVPALAFIWGT